MRGKGWSATGPGRRGPEERRWRRVGSPCRAREPAQPEEEAPPETRQDRPPNPAFRAPEDLASVPSLERSPIPARLPPGGRRTTFSPPSRLISPDGDDRAGAGAPGPSRRRGGL